MNIEHVVVLSLMAFAILILWYIMVHIEKEQNKLIAKKFSDMSDMYSAMNRIRDKTCIERLFIIRTHNGDGVPKYGYKLKVSVLYESYGSPFRSEIKKLQDLPVTQDYMDMLNVIMSGSAYAKFVDDMDPGLIRDIYKGDNAYWLYVFKIGQDQRGIYYCAMTTTQPTTPFKENKALEVKILETALRDNFSKIYKKRSNVFKRMFYI